MVAEDRDGAQTKLRRVEAAVTAWTGQLIDLGGRNTLLYYKDLRQGTLNLGPGSGADSAPVDALLASRTVRLSDVFGAATLGSAARRARTIRAKATENFEERGLRTLYLAWTLATWENLHGTAVPAAPVLLRAANLTTRGTVGEDFDLSLTGEWEINPTLLHLLDVDYNVKLDGEELLALLDEAADRPDPGALLARLAHVAASVPGFAINDARVIGNFSYAKLPMVKDLEAATDELLQHELLCAIAGDEAARTAIRARHPDVHLNDPDHAPLADEFLVCDADASQSYVINCVVHGADLVVEGPPGTGKSQTIANLIGTLAARGQLVLFVAEKRAAIDAVVDRLRRVGLEDLVLDLHDGAGSRRKLAQELSQGLAEVARVPLPNVAELHGELERYRAELVERESAIHEARPPWGVSIYDVQSRLLAIRADAQSGQRLPGDSLTALDGPTMTSARADLDRFASLGGFGLLVAGASEQPSIDTSRSGVEHPTGFSWARAFWSGSVTSPEAAASALDAATRLLQHTLPATTAQLNETLAGRSLPSAETLADWSARLTMLDGVNATLSTFVDRVYSEELPALVARLTPASRGGISRFRARLFSASYRRASYCAHAMCKDPKRKVGALYASLAAAVEQQTEWRRLSSDGSSPTGTVGLVTVRTAYSQLLTEVKALEQWTGLPLADLDASVLSAQLSKLVADRTTLYRLPELHRLYRTLHALGLGQAIAEMAGRNLTPDQALQCLDHIWLSSILESVSIMDPRVGTFDGEALRRTVRGFRTTDTHHIETASMRIRRAVAERVTQVRDAYPRESDVIEHQARLKRKHMPVRDLFQAAPHVLAALKPCWAMSPLVVSQLLPPACNFDVVIFDEASQVTPADSAGALLRARRAVVAGDSHQLPPTSFFLASGGGEDDEEFEPFDADPALTSNLESVLDVMGALLPPPNGTRNLGWHYRSRDERLIAFSNAQPDLYDFSLTTFPGVSRDGCIDHVLVPFVPGRVNQEDSVSDEVIEVVRLVAEHARHHAGESLGVIAMGIKHANRITEAVRRARMEDAVLDAFLDEGRAEPFFVKNLERVQGDERDAIILSIGYGKTADGRLLYRFGPLNLEGGERRLNVAITRARNRMTVVSSFSALDMDPNKLRAAGAKMLCRYLAYASSGGADLGNVAADKPVLNPFERDIRDHLVGAGIPLVAQYGCSGYWIDFAAGHPTQPGRMVLAIECDGASYHSAATARDRDRLRQEHLERLGWRFHRIWSSEWFHHREAEVARAVVAYRDAIGPGGGNAPEPPIVSSPAIHDLPPAPIRQTTSKVGYPPMASGRDIGQYSHQQLVALVRWIESDTLLRTEDELLASAMAQLGFTRRGPKIVEAIRAAIAEVRHGVRPPLPPPRPPKLRSQRQVVRRRPRSKSWWRY